MIATVQHTQQKPQEFPKPEYPAEAPGKHIPEAPELPPDTPEPIPPEQPVEKPEKEIQEPDE